MRSIGKREGSRPGEFSRPSGVAIDSRDRLIVSECAGRRIQLMSLEGEPLQLVKLTQPCTAKQPAVLRSVCYADGKAYVCDFANHQIVVLRLMEGS